MADEKEMDGQKTAVKTPEFQAALREVMERLRASSPKWTEDEIGEVRRRIEEEASDKLDVWLVMAKIMLEKTNESLRKMNEALARTLEQLQKGDEESRRRRIERGGDN